MTAKAWNKVWILPLIFFAIAGVFAVLYFDKQEEGESLVDSKGLWKDLIEGKKPSLLLLGDIFVYQEKDSTQNSVLTIHNSATNSLEELRAFELKNSQPHIQRKPLTEAHLDFSSAQWVKQLTKIFVSINSDYSLQLVSQFDTELLHDYDILVIGKQNTLGIFKSYWTPSKIKYDEINDAFYYQNDEHEDPIFYQSKGNTQSFHTDYGYLAKVPGPNNNSIYLFSGLKNTGTTQSLQNFTDTRLLPLLEQYLATRFGKLPEYYEVLFEVNGINQTELNSEIIYAFQIDK